MLTALLLLVIVALSVVFLLYTGSLRRAQEQQSQNEERLRQMADNIQEVFWMLDAKTRKTLYVNQAYETITHRTCQSLRENPSSYEEVIHPEDRPHILAKLEEATRSGHFDEQFRITWPTGEVRWVWVRGFPVRDSDGVICRLVGTAQDVTRQKQAEDEVTRNLALAQSAWADAEALRKATLSLIQDIRMDFVLDTLLQSLTELVPCECARIWLLEGETHLFVAREKLRHELSKKRPAYPLAINAADLPFLERILQSQKSVLLPDTKEEPDWRLFKNHIHLRSWLCVPLIASQRTLGLLSLGQTEPDGFTQEDLRRAQLLAIPAAAAIQNARLYECASIYGSELERREDYLKEAQQALQEAKEARIASEAKFEAIFRASPIPFSITTIDEGRFLDVNAAFERAYGYSRAELVGHTLEELRIWEDAADSELFRTQIQRTGSIRNIVARLRTKAGEIRLTAYSADRIHFNGLPCVLAVSEGIPQQAQNPAH